MRPPRRGVSYSEALAAAYASAPETDLAFDTLEFIHPAFLDGNGQPTGVRVVNAHHTLTARLESTAPRNAGEYVDFSPVRFSFRRPAENESGAAPEVEVTVDNVAKLLIPYLDRVKESRELIKLIWRPYMLSDLTGPHMNPPLQLTMTTVTGGMTSVTGRAGFSDLTNRRFPAREYTARLFPGLTAR